MSRYEQFEELNPAPKKDYEVGERLRGTDPLAYDWRWVDPAANKSGAVFTAVNDVVLFGCRDNTEATYPQACLAYLHEDVTWNAAGSEAAVPDFGAADDGRVPYSLYIPDLDAYLRYL